MALNQGAADTDDMHDGEHPRFGEICFLDRAVIGKKTLHCRIPAKTRRRQRGDQRVDPTAVELVRQRRASGNRLQFDSAGSSSLTRASRPGSSSPPLRHFTSAARTPYWSCRMPLIHTAAVIAYS